MRIAIVLEFDIANPEDASTVLRAIDPPKLPFFDGAAQIVMEPHLSQMLRWLDE